MLRHRATRSRSFRKFTPSFTREHRHWGYGCYLEVDISNFRVGQLRGPLPRRSFSNTRENCQKETQKLCELGSQFLLNLFDTFRKSGLHATCPTAYVWFPLWPSSLFFLYLTPNYFWQDTEGLLFLSLYLNVLITLKKKKLKSIFPEKISLSSLKAHFNLIVWHSHSWNETLHGKHQGSCDSEMVRDQEAQTLFSEDNSVPNQTKQETPTRRALWITAGGRTSGTLKHPVLPAFSFWGLQMSEQPYKAPRDSSLTPECRKQGSWSRHWMKSKEHKPQVQPWQVWNVLEVMSGGTYKVRELE